MPKRTLIRRVYAAALVLAPGMVVQGMARAATSVVLHRFNDRMPHGINPYAGVVRDTAGNLYGTTLAGGRGNGGGGVVFKVNPAGSETVLHEFQGGTDGVSPTDGVILDAAGNLYGTTKQGGSANQGVVYKVAPGGQETVLYTFTGGTDGGNPAGGLVLDSAGSVYGTTLGGGIAEGTQGDGVIFKLSASGQEMVLYTFTTPGEPTGVIRDAAGDLFGTLQTGGAQGAGAIYELSAAGQFSLLYSFPTGDYESLPLGHLIRDSAGNIYGACMSGGATGAGMVYKLDPQAAVTVLYTFTGGADGGNPQAGLVRDAAGNLYGAAQRGGSAGGHGVVFIVDPAGQETVLHSFTNQLDGGTPNGALVRDPAGNLLGTTVYGGENGNSGVVYRLDTAGTETSLYLFPGGPSGGREPKGGVIRDSIGNLYGTTYHGGVYGAGLVYELDTSGRFSVLYPFTGGADGALPSAGLILDSEGNLYGTTQAGGAWGEGAVYKVDPSGKETVLYSFTGALDGALPMSGVIGDPGGNLYGTTQGGGEFGYGVVYKLDPSGKQTVLHTFTNGADGGSPQAGVIMDSEANLYGTTTYGGQINYEALNYGVVYKLDAEGNQTTLYTFRGPPTGGDGAHPYSGVVMDPAGNLYGTTNQGGTTGCACGIVYRIDTSGNETVLYKFGANGGFPSRRDFGRGRRSLWRRFERRSLRSDSYWPGDSPCRDGCGAVGPYPRFRRQHVWHDQWHRSVRDDFRGTRAVAGGRRVKIVSLYA